MSIGSEVFLNITKMDVMILILYVICVYGMISQVFLRTVLVKDPLKCFQIRGLTSLAILQSLIFCPAFALSWHILHPKNGIGL